LRITTSDLIEVALVEKSGGCRNCHNWVRNLEGAMFLSFWRCCGLMVGRTVVGIGFFERLPRKGCLGKEWLIARWWSVKVGGERRKKAIAQTRDLPADSTKMKAERQTELRTGGW
jgi:hypothetical protein